jgi:drug/metabolite transporter (DMT)-like permease
VNGTPVGSMLLVLVASFIGSFGAVMLKLGAVELNKGFWHILNAKLGAGVALFLASSYFFVAGIRHGELSVLYPMVSLGYIWTLLWARLIFKEAYTRQKFLGLALILLGVFFVGLGSK